MLQKTIQVMECSRIFSLPMSILSWLAIFVYALIDSGNPWYGILALIGICLVHLGTNLVDDYFDYRYLIKQVDFDRAEYLKNKMPLSCKRCYERIRYSFAFRRIFYSSSFNWSIFVF